MSDPNETRSFVNENLLRTSEQPETTPELLEWLKAKLPDRSAKLDEGFSRVSALTEETAKEFSAWVEGLQDPLAEIAILRLLRPSNKSHDYCHRWDVDGFRNFVQRNRRFFFDSTDGS